MLDRLVRILDSFDAQNPTLTVNALAHRADVPQATAYRLVDDLVAHGLLARDADRQVRLGVRCGSWPTAVRQPWTCAGPPCPSWRT